MALLSQLKSNLLKQFIVYNAETCAGNNFKQFKAHKNLLKSRSFWTQRTPNLTETDFFQDILEVWNALQWTLQCFWKQFDFIWNFKRVFKLKKTFSELDEASELEPWGCRHCYKWLLSSKCVFATSFCNCVDIRREKAHKPFCFWLSELESPGNTLVQRQTEICWKGGEKVGGVTCIHDLREANSLNLVL